MDKILQAHNHATDSLIQVANSLHQTRSQEPTVVSAGLMAAASIYNLFLDTEERENLNENQKQEMVKGLKSALHSTHQDLAQCTDQFMDSAGGLFRKGLPARQVSAALMAASAIYATFVTAGNKGFLRPEGVDKVAAKFGELLRVVTGGMVPEAEAQRLVQVYRKNLGQLQKLKKAQLVEEGHEVEDTPAS